MQVGDACAYLQYGELFTFIMMGRQMTVALGPKGNNLSLGGKLSQVSAEEAYTVGLYLKTRDSVLMRWMN